MKSASLYAIQFSHGVVKIGVATSTKNRLRSLKTTNFKGRKIESYATTPKMEHASFAAERVLLSRMAKVYVRASGAESFFCTNFRAVVTMMRQVMKKFVSDGTGWRVFDGIKPFNRKLYDMKNRRPLNIKPRGQGSCQPKSV